ncbi:MAG: pyridoxamine 5'-phosphate oxidase family protein [Pseudomonadota bacterium]
MPITEPTPDPSDTLQDLRTDEHEATPAARDDGADDAAGATTTGSHASIDKRRGLPLPPFYDDLDGSLRHAWSLLQKGVHVVQSRFHTMAVATVGLDGAPQVRTVVLRGSDTASRQVRFHTDQRSAKFNELQRNPLISLHFYDPGAKIQLRLTGEATCHTEGPVWAQAWDATRPNSRACYRQTVGPGAAIDEPFTPETIARTDDACAAGQFCAVVVQVTSLEWLYLAARGHRRARFTWSSEGDQRDARWLAP